MNKAVFLDRDGVLNKEIGRYVTSEEEFELLEDVPAVLSKFASHGYMLIVITNQGGIAKNLYSHEGLHRIHQKLRELLHNHHVKLDAIFYCPHHPEYSGKCLCRKPDSLMLEKAMAIYDIDPGRSYFIGDNERDVEAAKKAGIKPVFIKSNSSLKAILEMIID